MEFVGEAPKLVLTGDLKPRTIISQKDQYFLDQAAAKRKRKNEKRLKNLQK